jgi:broad specificity phosphatase PhoE
MSQKIHLVRYGLRETELIPFIGPFNMGLHADGVTTANEHGALLKTVKQEGRELLFVSSPFRRSVTTASIAASCIPGAVVAVETGVTEWYTESLVSSAPHTECFVPDPIASSDWASDMGNIDREYKSVFPLPAFPETEEAMLLRCGDVVRSIAKLHADKDLVLVSHAPCLLAFAMALSGASPLTAQISPWVLGGVSTFVRQGNEWAWAVEREQHTLHLTGAAKDGIGGWTLPCLESREPKV